MSNLIPPINTKGFYSLKAPWSTANNTIYECIAIREFKDFTDAAADIYGLVYEPMGLAREIYEADRAAGVKILTLRSTTRPTIYVPSSYLLSYPSNDNVAYQHTVLALSLGALPVALDLQFLIDQVQGVVSSVIGIVPEIKTAAAPSDEYITAVQHAQLEQGRRAAIEELKTDYTRVIELTALVDQLRAVIVNQENILRANGLLPE